MSKKSQKKNRFSDLTWNDIEDWAGWKIVSRGRDYQRQGLVSDLAAMDDGSLIAWVDGTDQYATSVSMNEDGQLESNCTCPYFWTCKHAVAVVLDSLKRIENNQSIPQAKEDDYRLILLGDEDLDDNYDEDEDSTQDIEGFLKGKTKAQLIELFREFAQRHPEIVRDIATRQQLNSGNTRALTQSLREEIRRVGDTPGWQNYWTGEGYTPDYSGIYNKLETLLKAGYPDEILSIGRELIKTGTRQVAESDDEGDTAMAFAACMPLIVEAMDQSNLDTIEKLGWAVDALLMDDYDLCVDFEDYLHRQHPRSAWNLLAEQLLKRLKSIKVDNKGEGFNRNYQRDRISNWAIHALNRAGRKSEIIQLCEGEACKTGNYERLVDLLLQERRYEDAEYWIKEGIRRQGAKWPGIASILRGKLRNIRTIEKNWPVVAAMRAEEFVFRPSREAFTKCEKASRQARSWTNVRGSLLHYLETGDLPWKQKDWLLPETGLDPPDAEPKKQYPMVNLLIDIAMLEKKPDQVIKWYDRRPEDRYGWYGIEENSVAEAISTYAPDRAVAIWKNMAERQIARVKPSAYREAVRYLRKAAKVMIREKKQREWEAYIKATKEQHFRKRRLMEILDSLEDRPIIKKRR